MNTNLKLLVIDGHLSHYLDNLEQCIILRCSTSTISKRLERRGYSGTKLIENEFSNEINTIENECKGSGISYEIVECEDKSIFEITNEVQSRIMTKLGILGIRCRATQNSLSDIEILSSNHLIISCDLISSLAEMLILFHRADRRFLEKRNISRSLFLEISLLLFRQRNLRSTERELRSYPLRDFWIFGASSAVRDLLKRTDIQETKMIYESDSERLLRFLENITSENK